IALVDYMMPGMDGEMLGRAIKSDPELQETTLVMLTSVSHRGEATRMSEAGYAGLLVKPVRPSQLFDLLATVWAKQAATRTTGSIEDAAAPLTQRAVGAPAISAANRSDESQAASVLLVEDNEINQRVAARMLQRLGCRVTIASHGKDALERVATSAFDLIIMD